MLQNFVRESRREREKEEELELDRMWKRFDRNLEVLSSCLFD
jgi:hypothetical protein